MGIFTAMGSQLQSSPGGVSHRTGTGAAVVPYIGKREANPAVNYVYGYKAVTADNGALKGAVHGVPALISAMGAHIQAAPGDVSHRTGTGAAVVSYIGKRAANPALNYIYGYKAVAGSNGDLAGAVHEVPALVSAFGAHTQVAPGDVSHRTGTGAAVPYIGKREANPAVNYVYGYKAVTADNGALKGAVHEVPALISAMGAHIQ